MKKVAVLGLMLVVVSCAGYFNPDSTSAGGAQSISELRIGGADGDFLSSDTANDISPYLYHSTNGDSYLFFASDRSGNYDIYYAKQTGDYFEAPRALGAEFNTADDEMFPAVFFNESYMTLNLIFLNKQKQEVQRYVISIDESEISGVLNSSLIVTNVEGLFVKNNYDSDLFLYDGTTNIKKCFLESMGYSYSGEENVDYPVYGGSEFDLNSLPLIENIYDNYQVALFETIVNGNHQIFNLRLFNGEAIYTYQTVPAYSSYAQGYNDKNPFIDVKDGTKVYFASDRYEASSDYYDLYRYNDKTIAREVFGVDGDYQPTAVYIDVNNGLTNYSGFYSGFPQKNIGYGVDYASSHNIDNVYIAEGVYTPLNEGVVSTNNNGARVGFSELQNMNITGGYDPGFNQVVGASVLDGLSIESNYIAEVNNCTNVTINNLVFQRGNFKYWDNNAGGVVLGNSSNVTFENCGFNYNTNTNAYSGAVSVSNCQHVTITDCDFISNSSPIGGSAVYLQYSHHCDVNGKFIGNRTQSSLEFSGAVYLNESQDNIIGGIFLGNVTRVGGIVFINASSSGNTISGEYISNIVEQSPGAVIYDENEANTIIQYTLISNEPNSNIPSGSMP